MFLKGSVRDRNYYFCSWSLIFHIIRGSIQYKLVLILPLNDDRRGTQYYARSVDHGNRVNSACRCDCHLVNITG